MSEIEALFTKVSENDTAKFVAKKIFKKFNEAVKKHTVQREAMQALESINPINKDIEEEVFEKISDRYLKFRTLLSRDVDQFISDVYHPLKISKFEINAPSISLLSDTDFRFPKIACIVGKAGQGKTTLLRKMFLNQIESDNSEFPIIITLRKIDWVRGDITPPKIIVDEFKALSIDMTVPGCGHLLKLKRLKVFFDGFDEVPLAHRKKAINLINATYNEFNSNCIVTTRPGTEIQFNGGAIHNYKLLDLEKSDVVKIIEDHFVLQTQDKEQLLNVLNTKPEITGILLTPILVDVFASTYNSLVADPTTIIDVYEQLFQALSSSHDRFKIMFERTNRSGLSNKDLEKVFWAASFYLFKERNDITFRKTELIESFEHASKKLGFNVSNAYTDVIDKTSLIKQDGLEYSYLHKSIIEFYTAKHIQSLPDNTRSQFYNLIFEKSYAEYENVLNYLSEIDTSLFYIKFISPYITMVKGNTDLFDFENIKSFCDIEGLENSTEIIKELFHVFLGEVTILVNVSAVTGELSFEYDHFNNDLCTKFLLISFILGSDTIYYGVNFKYLDDVIVEIFNDNKKIEFLNKNKEILTYKNHKYIDYRIHLVDLIDLHIVSADIIESEFIEAVAKFLYELNESVKTNKKIYSQKSELDLF